jgi:putative transposase
VRVIARLQLLIRPHSFRTCDSASCLRRSKSIETLLPILYLRGISTGDFAEALAALLGKDAPGLSASAIARLKDGWLDEYEARPRRDLTAKRYVYAWADGIYLQAQLEDEKQCILVRIGATPEGRKELIGFTDGARESAQDWPISCSI